MATEVKKSSAGSKKSTKKSAKPAEGVPKVGDWLRVTDTGHGATYYQVTAVKKTSSPRVHAVFIDSWPHRFSWKGGYGAHRIDSWRSYGAKRVEASEVVEFRAGRTFLNSLRVHHDRIGNLIEGASGDDMSAFLADLYQEVDGLAKVIEKEQERREDASEEAG